MNITKEEENALAGEDGWVRKRMMEILVGLGEIYGAERLIPVRSVHVAGVSYKTIGDAGLEWIESLGGVEAVVPTTINPGGIDLERWRQMGVGEEFAEKQKKIIEALRGLGMAPLCSCTPYLLGNAPSFGEHVAWAESSAVCYANSVLGARTNREGGPSAIASALTGKTALYGYHLDENRKPTVKVKITAPLAAENSFGSLGFWVGKRAKDGVPYFTGIPEATLEELKALSAALAASGGVALFHIAGLTPEADRWDGEGLETLEFGEGEMGGAAEELNTLREEEWDGKVDLVCLGCPHTSLDEIKEISSRLRGKRVRDGTRLWIFTSRQTRSAAAGRNLLANIERAGGEVYSDCCMVVAPIEELGFRSMAVNSAKAAVYAPSTSKVDVLYRPLEECLKIATGRG